MNIGWILLIAAISLVALYVIFRPKRSRDNVAGKVKFNWGPPGVSKGYSGDKTIVVHGEPALGVSVAAHPTATAANRATVARARQRARVSRDESTDTSLTDALVLSTILSNTEPYEPELPQPSPEPEYVPAPTPEPQPYCPPEPDHYRAPDPTPSYESSPTYESSSSSCDSSPSYSGD